MLTHGIAILRCDITKVAAQQNEIARLFKLSARNLKAAQQFPCSCSPKSLGDVCRNRRTGAPQLRYDPVLFSPRKFCRQLVNFEREFMSFLPNRKVLKRLDLHSSMCLLTLHQSPVTINYPADAAPLTTSIISRVIAACRTLFMCSVKASITSEALLVADSIAVIRAACSAAEVSASMR